MEQERFPEFLRYHLLCELPRVRSQRLFKLIRDRTKTSVDVFALLDELEPRAELFAALADPNHGYWIERRDAQRSIRELNLFRVRQATPLLFTAWEALSEEDFVRVLRLVSAVSFRHTVVSGLNTNALELVYHRAAKAVRDGTARTPAAVFDHLRTIYVDDVKTRQDFATLAVSTSGQRRKLAKYVLARLEQDAADRPCDPETDPGSIEHILPENPSDEWRETFAPDRWESSVYRLGNLTPAGAEPQPGDPGPGARTLEPELLDARQRRLASRAAHLWRSDFAQ